MPTPPTGDEFLDLVRKSGVVDDKKLAPYVDPDGKTRYANEPGKLAGLLVRDGVLTRFQAEQFLQGKWRRFTIGKYKVLDRIGTGGMGSVYLCEHKFMRRLAAVKVLPTARAKDPSALERFYREARVVAALDHPNIVRAYDIDQEDDLHFLVMEYVDGASLQEIVRREGPLEPVRCADYISQAALGLQHAHEVAAIVHRDIKPGNLIVDRAGTLKVLDMGLARFFNDEADLLTKKYDENVLGTADYLAPEQVLDSHGVDIRADIYSLGATAYFCLTGRTPFGEGTIAQKLIWHQTRQPKPIRSFRSDVPEGMLAVLEKMMAKDAAQRYRTPAEVVHAIQPWTKPPATQAPSNPAAQRKIGKSSERGALRSSAEIVRAQAASPQEARKAPAAAAGNGNVIAVDEDGAKGIETPSLAGLERTGSETDLSGGVGADSVTTGSSTVPEILVPASTGGGPGEDNEGLVWESLTSDTPNPVLKADTARNRPLKVLPPGHQVSTGPKIAPRPALELLMLQGARLWWAIAGASLLVFLLLIFLAMWLAPGGAIPQGGSGPAPASSNTVVVDQADPRAAYIALSKAIHQARPNQHIIVSAPVIEGSLDLTRTKQITIEAAQGKQVLWRLPDKQTERTLLYFHEVKNVVFRGFVLDGQDKVDHIAELAMSCPGLTLENLELRGFLRSGILVANCAGNRDHPVSLSGLRFIANAQREAGITFEMNPKIAQPTCNDYMHVSGCDFVGLGARWKLQNPLANGSHVDLQK
jgi:serine/threonine protein kinase